MLNTFPHVLGPMYGIFRQALQASNKEWQQCIYNYLFKLLRFPQSAYYLRFVISLNLNMYQDEYQALQLALSTAETKLNAVKRENDTLITQLMALKVPRYSQGKI